jgi:hypothetical protein
MNAAEEGSKWMKFIKVAVENLNDEKIYTHFMPYIKSLSHPSVQDQQIMANSLIQFIDKNIEW